MQVSVEKQDGLTRILNITVDAAQFDKLFNVRLQKVAQDVKMDGFRPGKVPLNVVKQRYGASISQEVAGEIMSSTFWEAAQKESIQPAGMPTFKVNKLETGQDFEYTATVEVFPTIELQSLAGNDVERVTASISEADLDTVVQRLRGQKAEFAVVDRASQKEDEITIDFDGSMDGEPLPQGQANDFKLVLGSDTMIPGFEDGLLGKKAGDEFEMNLAFPEDYHHKDVAGKPVSFKIKVHSVSEQKLPELDDAFFAEFNVKEPGLDGFKQHIRKDMERDLTQRLKSLNKKALFDALLKQNSIEVPTPLVEQEIDSMLEEAKRPLAHLEQKNKPLNIPRDLFREEATRRVHLGLLVQEFITSNDMKADEARLEAEINTMAEAYEDPEEYRRWIANNENVRKNFEALVLEDQVADALAEQASMKEVTKSYDEIINPKETEVDGE